MHRTTALSILTLALVAITLASCSSHTSSTSAPGTPQAAPSTPPTQQQAPSQNTNRIKLSQTPIANYAYVISDPNLSSRAQQAISGFSRTRTQLANGSIQIALKALEPQYQDQTIIVPKGDTLYFVETSYGDDPSHREYSLGDDRAILVDSNGYVVQ